MAHTFLNIWLPYIYLYGVGGFGFGIGMWIIKKSGAYNPNKKRHRYWWRVLLFGFFYFAIMHLVWILLALNT